MRRLSRSKGMGSLVHVAFHLGGLLRIFALIRIQGFIRRGDAAAALKACTKQIQSSEKVMMFEKSGNPKSSTKINLMIGELLYTLGGEDIAIECIFLPVVRSQVKNELWTDAKFNLEEMLRAYPESSEVQSLLSKLPF